MDNYFTSIHLAYNLLQAKTLMVGTLRSNRMFPELRLTNGTSRGVLKGAKVKQCPVTLLAWMDKKLVYTISTLHSDQLLTSE